MITWSAVTLWLSGSIRLDNIAPTVFDDNYIMVLCPLAFMSVVCSPTHQYFRTLPNWLASRSATFCELLGVKFDRGVLTPYCNIKSKVTTLANHENAFAFYYASFMPHNDCKRGVDNFVPIKETIKMLYGGFRQTTYNFASDWLNWAANNGFIEAFDKHEATRKEAVNFVTARDYFERENQWVMMMGQKGHTFHSLYPTIAAMGVVLKIWQENSIDPHNNTMHQYAIRDILMRVPNKHIFQSLLQKMSEYKPQMITEFDDIDVE